MLLSREINLFLSFLIERERYTAGDVDVIPLFLSSFLSSGTTWSDFV
jgi:hypothetical protein